MTDPQPKPQILQTPDGWYFVGVPTDDEEALRLSDLYLSISGAQRWLDEHPEGEGENVDHP